jgi:predicted phosphoribosyltransferase
MTRSEWANNLVNDSHFLEVFTELKNIEISRIVNSNESDIQERESAYSKLNAIQSVYNHIVSLADQRKINEKRWKIF